jgi:UDP-glucose 4-epimerase
MARKRYMAEEILAKLRQIDVLVSQGQTMMDAIRQIGVSERIPITEIDLRCFNAAGGDPDSEIGEAHDSETHLIPLVLAAACTGARVRVFGNDYDTLDGTCVGDYSCQRHCGRARSSAGLSP